MSPPQQPESATPRPRGVLVALPPDKYRALAEQAELESRTPPQQARHLLLKALADQERCRAD